MDTVRWGLLSTANINRRVIPAIRASERGELVAVASRSSNKAAEYAAKWKIPSYFGDYAEMLKSDTIDAVYISLPNHLHARWSINALEAGKHVLCEKPLALSLDEVDEMASAAEQTGKNLAEAFMYRHHPQTKIVGDWIQSGRLGEITYFQGIFNFTGMAADNVRLVPEWGGGALWDVGVYPMSLAQYVMGGPPQWVVGDQQLGDSGVDMVFSGQLHYSGSRMAQISCAFKTPFHSFVQILGTEGTLTIDRPFVQLAGGPHLYFKKSDGSREPVPVPSKELYSGEIEDMNASVLDGTPNYLSLAESRDHIRTILALYDSARNKSARVNLS
jgi:predicted dehydrogenase